MVVPNQPTVEERDVQRSYWKEHSTEATVEAMMLDSQASVIDEQERPEVRGNRRGARKKRVLVSLMVLACDKTAWKEVASPSQHALTESSG